MGVNQPQLTRCDRQMRRERIVSARLKGESIYDLAEQFGVSRRYVRQIVSDAGHARPAGRPRRNFFQTHEQAKQYHYLLKKVGSKEARQLMGLPPL